MSSPIEPRETYSRIFEGSNDGSIWDNIPGVIYQLRLAADGSISFPYISSGCQELLRISPAAVVADANALLGMMHVADIQNFQETVAESARTLMAVPWCGRAILANGELKWLESSARPKKRSDGSVVWDGVLVDVTDRKLTEIALQESRQRYQRLVNNVPCIIYQCRLQEDGSISFPYISDQIEVLFGLDPEEIAADASVLEQAIHPEDRAAFCASISSSAQRPYAWEGRLLLATGETRWISIDAFPEQRVDGSTVWDGILVDITAQHQAGADRKAAEIALQQSNQRLEITNQELQQATRLKDEFLASMSHELRTPLNAILGMSESLQELVFGDLNDQQLQLIATIERSGKHLLALINDILDVSKVVAGKLELEIGLVSATQLGKSCLPFVTPQAIQKNIQIATELSAELPQINVDERRLRQVLINLLSNAVKFTPAGGQVTLSIGLEQREGGKYLRLAVKDTGIGIAEADRSQLFQPFIQIDSSLNRKYEGTGLGLTLAKQIIDLHGGSIEVQSIVGAGSCFVVYLPPGCISTSPVQPVASTGETSGDLGTDSGSLSPPRKVLLAENNAANIQTVSSYLRAKGYQVLVAGSGSEAIELSHQHHPDAILMDLQLPGMNSLTAIAHLHQQPDLAHIPIVALTALVAAEERERTLAAGASDYLVKPVKLQEIDRTIRKRTAELN
jgi:signal transduction histidine kinase/ActR/RegA family two-component response regulator